MQTPLTLPPRQHDLGGEELPQHHMRVLAHSSTPLSQARDDWMAQRFPAVPGETGFIPYPAAKA